MQTRDKDQVAAPWSYYRDPGDLFVQLYDLIPDAVFRQGDAEAWAVELPFRQTSEIVTQLVESTGRLDRETVEPIMGLATAKELLAVAVGLDEGLRLASPFEGVLTPNPLAYLRRRYVERGRLNDATDGAILPRRTYPGRVLSAKEKRDFFSVLRVPPPVWGERYKNGVVPSMLDPVFSPGQEVAIGFCALLDNYDDLGLTLVRKNGRSTYRIRPAKHLEHRLAQVLDALDSSGVQIGVLPEVALSDELYDAWRSLLRRTSRNARRHSSLRWLLLGSGPIGSRPNCAVLVDRWSGREILLQDKLADFTFTEWQFKTWRLPKAEFELESNETVREDIPRDVLFTTVDASLGRIGVLICETLSRWPETWNVEITSSGISHAFVPVFGKPLQVGGWEEQASTQLMNLVGTWVMVANSIVLANELATDQERGYSCLVTGPQDADRANYRAHRQFGRSAAADQLAPLEEGSLDIRSVERPTGSYTRWPWVHAAQLRPEWFPERIATIGPTPRQQEASRDIDVRAIAPGTLTGPD